MNRIFSLRNFDWLMFFVVCFFLVLSFFLVFDYSSIGKASYVFYLIILFCLFLVLIFRKTVYGAQRWFILGPVSMQPSEIMKIALVLALSRYFMDKKSVSGFSGVIFPLALTLLPMALIIKQPDLGTSLILLPIFFAIMFVVGTR